jgi:hypothetical protein
MTMKRREHGARRRFLQILARAGKPLSRTEIGQRFDGGEPWSALSMRNNAADDLVAGDDSTGWWITPAGRDRAYGPRPTVLMTIHDLFQVIHGREMTVGTVDGREAIVRLYTADELIARQHGLIDEAPEVGGTKIDRRMAEQLTTPWSER